MYTIKLTTGLDRNSVETQYGETLNTFHEQGFPGDIALVAVVDGKPTIIRVLCP